MPATSITERVKTILDSIPANVTLVAACKTRTLDEVREAVDAGITTLGHNYVQEAEGMVGLLDRVVSWHGIGHLQRNKAKKAVELFDVVETVDSVRLANKLDSECAKQGKVMRVLIEVNSGEESNKDGALPGDVPALGAHIAALPRLRLEGLMTMGPLSGDPEDARPYFHKTKELSLRLASALGAELPVLSMGMSNSYQVAIEEGATLIRLGTSIFGPRQ